MAKAYEGKKGVTIKMSKSQLAYDMKVEGGLLAKTVLPAIGVGAISGLANAGIQKH